MFPSNLVPIAKKALKCRLGSRAQKLLWLHKKRRKKGRPITSKCPSKNALLIDGRTAKAAACKSATVPQRFVAAQIKRKTIKTLESVCIPSKKSPLFDRLGKRIEYWILWCGTHIQQCIKSACLSGRDISLSVLNVIKHFLVSEQKINCPFFTRFKIQNLCPVVFVRHALPNRGTG